MNTRSSETTLPRMAWQALRGAVDDVEKLVPSERALWLQRGVDMSAYIASLLAWIWLGFLLLHLVITPVIVDAAVPLATANIGHRDAVFIILGVFIVGPLALFAVLVVLVFIKRVATDLLRRKLTRAFRPLAPNVVVLSGMMLLWLSREVLNRAVWTGFRELRNVFAIAAEFTPVVS